MFLFRYFRKFFLFFFSFLFSTVTGKTVFGNGPFSPFLLRVRDLGISLHRAVKISTNGLKKTRGASNILLLLCTRIPTLFSVGKQCYYMASYAHIYSCSRPYSLPWGKVIRKHCRTTSARVDLWGNFFPLFLCVMLTLFA